jgi:beta-glucosidase
MLDRWIILAGRPSEKVLVGQASACAGLQSRWFGWRTKVRRRLKPAPHNTALFHAVAVLAAISVAGLACAGSTPISLQEGYRGSFRIGAALNSAQFTEKDSRGAALVTEQFNTITPENVLKWALVHPQPGSYDFDLPDRYVAFGEKRHMFIVGHTLVWHNQIPAWVFRDGHGNPIDRDTLLARMRDHIHTVVGRYKGRIAGWDVVNEAVDEDGTLRQSPWLKIIGEDYIAKAFQFAHEADPKAELYYNDYSLENEAKRKGAIELIQKLQAQGIPIAAVGLQGHVHMDWPSVEQEDATIAAFARLGLKVNITELDVDVLPPATKETGADIRLNVELQAKLNPYAKGFPDTAQQALAKRYADLFGVYLKHRDVITRVTFWGVTDGDSWLNDWPVKGRTSYPLLFDRQAKPKPAFVAVAQVVAGQPLFRKPAEPMDKRIDDLLSRMTVEEKVSQLMNDSPSIERLGIPAYNWWNESLHGVARSGRATVFPQAIGIAATWDTDLMSRVATAISDEARAKYHEFLRRGKHNIYQGLTFWTPNINLFRDPRWGRGQETYGEDPFLTGRLAVAFVKGMQGDDPKYFKTIATAKHYAVHSGPEPLRHTFDAVPSEHDLWDTYLPHFEAAIREGGAYSVMCSYNSVDGLPACASPRLLDDILRKKWGFNGYVVSDCAAVGDIYKNHKLVPTPEEGVARALKSGTDLACGTEYQNLLPALKKGLIAESDIDRSLRRLLVARFKLGMFDPPEMVKWAQIPYSENDSPAHRELALETAHKSIVLLKNERQTLPLSKKLKTLAVIGPNADDVPVLLANYNGVPTAPVTPLHGIRQKLGSGTKVLYARGSDIANNLPNFEVIPSTALFTTNGSDRQNGLKGEYFNTANYDGKAHKPAASTFPVSDETVGQIPVNPQPLFTRVDPQVNFNWWDGAPRPEMDDDNFGIRWTGYLVPPVTGTYQLGADAANTFALYLDDKLVLQSRSIHGGDYRYEPVQLEAGKPYRIRIDYHEFVNDASIQLVWAPPRKDLADEALSVARQADAVVLVLGLSAKLEGEEMKVRVDGFEGGDRVSIGLPAVQEELMQRITALGKPVVVVLLNGSALAVNWAHDHIPAIVEAWYPGQAGGTALADVLFGDYNPAGRLPVTFYKSTDQLPPFADYGMKGRTYRYFTGEPLFPFGYGLSYTTFAYRNLRVPKQANIGDEVKLSVDVENTGSRTGEEVVELYVRSSAPGAPIRSLSGFQRVTLRPKEHKTVQFTVQPRQLALVDGEGRRRVEPGELEISVGGQQTGGVTAKLQVSGAAKELDQ